MKKYTFIIAALFLGLFFSACESRLDIPQKSVLSSETYYAEAGPEEAEALIARIYSAYYSSVNAVATTLFIDILSDDCLSGGNDFSDNANQLLYASELITTPEDVPLRNKYQGIYQVIYYCNLILEKIPETSDARINRVKAEANFMRALCMAEAVRWWGTPPFVTKVATSEEYYPSNGDPAEIIPWCLDRMQEAADALPALSGIGQQKAYGARISKHGALAYKGKYAVWYGQKYKDNKYVEIGKAALKQVIDSNLYGLIDDMYKIDRPAADFCKEYVFEHNAADNDGYPGNQAGNMPQVWVTWRPEHLNLNFPKGIYEIGWGWDVATKEFGDFLRAHEGGVEKPRFRSNIMTYEQFLQLEGKNGPMSIQTQGIANFQGYFRWKGVLFADDVYDMPGFWKNSMANTHYMRYSETLLLYAEACFLINGDADGSGLAALNQVRRRAQIEPLASMTYQDIKDERRAEMWCEGERYFDIVRWGDAPKLLANKGKYHYFFMGHKPGTTEWDIRTEPGTGSGWSDKFNLLPFPTNQLAANPNLVQNPGW